MAQLSAMHLVGLMFLFVCLSASATSLTIEQQLEEMKENYENRLNVLEQQNVKNQDILESKINELEVEVKEMERMEMKIEKQELFLSDLKQQSNSWRDDGRLAGWGSLFRQASGSSQVPRCCCDLLCNGETVSGLYSIMGNTSVEMVYCDFSKPPQDPNFQKWLGYVDVKSSPVYFYVQKNDSFDTTGVPIPFEVEKVNIGGAMNMTSGIFTAPRPGTYFFAFTGDVRFLGPTTTILAVVIELQLNGQRVGSCRVTENNPSGNVNNELTMQSTLKLKAGDKIWLQIFFMTAGGVAFVYDNPNDDQRFNHFTGLLLEENLSGRL